MRSLILLFVAALSLLGSASEVLAITDTLDVGVRDSIALSNSELIVSDAGSAVVVLELSVWSDSLPITGLSCSFRWFESQFVLDSVSVSQYVRDAFDFKISTFRNDSRDTSNSYKQFSFGGIRGRSAGLDSRSARQVIASYYFSTRQWSRLSSLTIDLFQFSPGTRSVMVSYDAKTFTQHRYTPKWSGPLVIHDPDRPCCVNIMGNIDGEDGVDIGDQTLLIDHLFGTGVALACVDAANVNGSADGSVDMADLIALTEHLFLGGQLAECK